MLEGLEEKGEEKKECSSEMRKLLLPFLGWCPSACIWGQMFTVVSAGILPLQKGHHVATAESAIETSLPLLPDKNGFFFSPTSDSHWPNLTRSQLVHDSGEWSYRLPVPEIIEYRKESMALCQQKKIPGTVLLSIKQVLIIFNYI